MDILVIHLDGSGNHAETTFSGPTVGGAVAENGVLTIRNWESEARQGCAIFAAGQWIRVVSSEERTADD